MTDQFIHDTIPDSVAYNFSTDVGYSTDIAELENQAESRNINWDHALREWSAEYEKFTFTDFRDLLRFFHGVYGSGYGFLFKDWFDFQIENQALGVAPAGSTPVQIYKDYIVGANINRRLIMKPRSAGLAILQAGAAKTVTVDPTTGLMTPTTAWTPGAALTIQYCEFDTPVRFRNDKLSASYVNFNAITTNCQLYEIKPPPIP